MTRCWQIVPATMVLVGTLLLGWGCAMIPQQASPRDLVKVAADWATGSIVVTASAEKQDEIAKLIGELDKATDTSRTTRVVEVEKNDARDVATARMSRG